MKRTLLASLLCVALIGLAVSFVDRPAMASTEDQISGCFSKGDSPGTFVLTDKKTGDKITVKGPESFGNHDGHEVKLTGEMKQEDGKKVFHATKMQHIAATCTVAGR